MKRFLTVLSMTGSPAPLLVEVVGDWLYNLFIAPQKKN
jgi:hypothetical protein